MSNKRLLLAADTATGPQGDSTDFFSTYVTSGTGATLGIVNGVDMSAGGMHSCKARTTTTSWRRTDTVRGATKAISSNLPSSEVTEAGGVTSFNSDGVTLGSDVDYNASGQDFVNYFFKESDKFFAQTLINHTNGVQSDYDASSLGEVGMVEVKQTDGSSDWLVWHKDLTASNNLRLNTTAAETPTNAYVSVSGATVSISSAAPTGDYIVYMYAHDPDTATGIIQCGSFTTDGAGNASVSLGWELQHLEIKRIDSTGNWENYDNIRGLVVGGADKALYPNLPSSETDVGNKIQITATGFNITYSFNATYIFRAIRRPNKAPTSGTEVFAVDSVSNTNPVTYSSGFPVDVIIHKHLNYGLEGHYLSARLVGPQRLKTWLTNAQESSSPTDFDSMDDITISPPGSIGAYTNGAWMFKRAPGFMDVVCYKGDGIFDRIVNHNLKAPVELVITKVRNSVNNWAVSSPLLAGDASNYGNLYLDTTESVAIQGILRKAGLTDDQYQVGVDSRVNGNTNDYIAILFATLPGISKVFSYTGNGTSQTIPCGFSSGARFILIKRTDSTGDWFLWDYLRGIVAGNDPHLSLNTTAAQVTTDDSVDPDSSGFIVNQVAATNINVNAANYIGLAIA